MSTRDEGLASRGMGGYFSTHPRNDLIETTRGGDHCSPGAQWDPGPISTGVESSVHTHIEWDLPTDASVRDPPRFLENCLCPSYSKTRS